MTLTGSTDAGALVHRVLNVVDFADKRGSRHDGVGPVLLEQRQPGTVCTGNGSYGVGGDLGQQLLKRKPVRCQSGQTSEALAEILFLGLYVVTRRSDLVIVVEVHGPLRTLTVAVGIDMTAISKSLSRSCDPITREANAHR